MKVLLLAASFPPPWAGGSIEYLYNIYSCLPPGSVVVHTGNAYPSEAQGFDQRFPQRVIRNHFIIHVMEGYRASKLARLREYVLWPLVAFWLIIRERPQAVHIGEYNMAGLAAWLAHRLLGIPYLLYVYAEEIPRLSKRPWHNFILLSMARDAQAVVTVCEYTRNLLVERGVARERVFKILPAVGHGKLWRVTPEQIERVRQKHHLDNRRVLLTVGTLIERKGHATVLEALPNICSSNPEVCYVIAGAGPREASLKERVREAGLEDRVIFAGRVDDIELACLYEICDVFVMPHRQVPTTLDTEGCPTVFLEASAHGKPVVGGNAGGVTDAILSERTGFIIDGKDEIALTNVVGRLLSEPNLARRMGEAGYEYTSPMKPERNAAEIWQISKWMVKNGRGEGCV